MQIGFVDVTSVYIMRFTSFTSDYAIIISTTVPIRLKKQFFLVTAYDERNEEKLSDLSPLQSSRKREKDMRHIIVRSACSLNTFVMRAKHHYLCMKRFAFPAILFSDKNMQTASNYRNNKI